MSTGPINQLLDHLAQQPPSIPLAQAERWVRQGREQPKSYLIIWLCRVKSLLAWRIN